MVEEQTVKIACSNPVYIYSSDISSLTAVNKIQWETLLPHIWLQVINVHTCIEFIYILISFC